MTDGPYIEAKEVLGGYSLLETASIDEVARRLGIRSLDRAARFIGWGWAPQPADGDRA